MRQNTKEQIDQLSEFDVDVVLVELELVIDAMAETNRQGELSEAKSWIARHEPTN